MNSPPKPPLPSADNRASPAVLLLLAAILLFVPGAAAHGEAFDSEEGFTRHLQRQLGGEKEVTLPDRTRVDLLTPDYAIEVDRARRWAQAVGQSLHYARMTARRPAIVLLSRAEEGGRYFRRIVGVIEAFDLPILLMLLDVETLRLPGWTSTPLSIDRDLTPR